LLVDKAVEIAGDDWLFPVLWETGFDTERFQAWRRKPGIKLKEWTDKFLTIGKNMMDPPTAWWPDGFERAVAQVTCEDIIRRQASESMASHQRPTRTVRKAPPLKAERPPPVAKMRGPGVQASPEDPSHLSLPIEILPNNDKICLVYCPERRKGVSKPLISFRLNDAQRCQVNIGSFAGKGGLAKAVECSMLVYDAYKNGLSLDDLFSFRNNCQERLLREYADAASATSSSAQAPAGPSDDAAAPSIALATDDGEESEESDEEDGASKTEEDKEEDEEEAYKDEVSSAD
jgi:hypothetical protein